MTLRRAILYAVLSGILIVLSLPHFDLWPLSWIAFVPLLIAIQKVDKLKSVFFLGLITGVIYFLGMTYWIIPLYPFAGSQYKLFNIFLTLLGSIALAAYSAVYVAGFAVILFSSLKRNCDFVLIAKAELRSKLRENVEMKKIRWRSGLLYIFSAAVFWTALEWVRGWFLSGYPWGYIGYAQWKDLPFIQLASITGVYGVSFLLILVNATISNLIIKWSKWREGIKSAIIPVCIILLTFVYGFIVMSQDLTNREKVKVVLVPGNIRQINKWQRRNLPKIFIKYLKTTVKAVDESTELIIWPETSIPTNLFSVRRAGYFRELKAVLKELNVDLFLGVSYDREMKSYNAAFLISSEGEILDSYYKIHLVPISESIPLKQYIPKQIWGKIVGLADFESGKRMTVFRLPKSGIPFGTVICFESAFPNLFRKFVKKGALFMGVITNDSWFEGTGCAEQHYAMAPFRAVENRVPIFHCGNGGISCIIDIYGRETEDKVVAFKRDSDGFVKGELTIGSNRRTIYTRYGDWFPIICSVLLIVFVSKSVYDYYRRRKQ